MTPVDITPVIEEELPFWRPYLAVAFNCNSPILKALDVVYHHNYEQSDRLHRAYRKCIMFLNKSAIAKDIYTFNPYFGTRIPGTWLERALYDTTTNFIILTRSVDRLEITVRGNEFPFTEYGRLSVYSSGCRTYTLVHMRREEFTEEAVFKFLARHIPKYPDQEKRAVVCFFGFFIAIITAACIALPLDAIWPMVPVFIVLDVVLILTLFWLAYPDIRTALGLPDRRNYDALVLD